MSLSESRDTSLVMSALNRQHFIKRHYFGEFQIANAQTYVLDMLLYYIFVPFFHDRK
jgi:hypothetical protein